MTTFCQVDQYKSDLEHAKNEVDSLTKAKEQLKADKDKEEGIADNGV